MAVMWRHEGEGTRVVGIWLEDGNVITVQDVGENVGSTALDVSWETLGPEERALPQVGTVVAGKKADSLTQLEPDTLLTVYSEQAAFRLLPDGTTEIEGDITPDEAAKLFWESLGEYARAHILGAAEVK